LYKTIRDSQANLSYIISAGHVIKLQG